MPRSSRIRCGTGRGAGSAPETPGGRTRRGDVVTGEDRTVPVRLEPMGARAPPLPVEMELLGRIHPAEVVVQGDPLRGHRLEPVRPAGGAREAGPAARPWRLRVGLQPDVRAHQPPMWIEPHPRGAATLGDVGGGALGNDELHRPDDATAGGAAEAAPPALVRLPPARSRPGPLPRAASRGRTACCAAPRSSRSRPRSGSR